MKKITRFITVSCTLTLGLISWTTLRSEPAAPICPDCKKTALLTEQSVLAQARSDYFRMVASASTFLDEVERGELLDEAKSSYREAYLLARKQLAVRLDLCRILDECQYDPEIDPDNFLTPEEIAANPNPYWPMIPGQIRRYRSNTDEGEEEIIEVEITDDVRIIEGVPCIVVRDKVMLEGEVVEDTFDWYAKDKDGNVWYFGELTIEFEDGEIIGLEGSFEAGVDGGKPGIAMPANPQVGYAYRQEMFLTQAEDWGRIAGVNRTITVEYGKFEGCLETENYNPNGADPTELETKYYAPGVGFIYEVKPNGVTVELIAFENP